MKPTLFSVSYAGLWGQHRLGVDAFIRKAAALGYSAVELMGKRPHLSPIDTSPSEAQRVRRTAQECQIEIASVAAYTDFTAPASAGTPCVEIQWVYVESLCRLAAELGAKIVRIFTGYRHAEGSHGKEWADCVSAVRECAEIAERHGVCIGLQNHHDLGVAFEAYSEFLEEVAHPACKAMFDPWAPALHGDDLYAAARSLAPRMVQTTLADYVRLRRFKYQPDIVQYVREADALRAVPLGDGVIDNAAFLRGLRDGGFDGYVAYEMCSPLRGGGNEENLDRSARRSLAAIQGMIG
ncbi:MAG: sugar phosphate isomerase/epimerase [Spirochaetes bacterium]|nr:sugar phosphate isomerase/epimerase [Spirochaetota bacterium]